MADLKISQLTGATTPLAGTEVLPIVQSSSTKKIATDDLTVKNIRSNATTGILQVAGPATAATRTMTVPDANFTAARTDAGQTFTGVQVMTSPRIITSINDTNGNELIGITATASAVNEITVANAATGNNPVVSATGADTNIGITLTPKGTGNVTLSTGNLVVANGNGIDFSATPDTGTSELLNDYEEGTWTGTVTASVTAPTSPSTTTGYYTKIGNLVTVRFENNVVDMTGSSGSLYVTGLPFTSRNQGGNVALGSCVFFNIDLPAGSMNIAATLSLNSSFVFFIASVDNNAYEFVTDNSETAGRIWFNIAYEV